jgi:hypothetical protein
MPPPYAGSILGGGDLAARFVEEIEDEAVFSYAKRMGISAAG